MCTTQFSPLLAAYRLILIHSQEKNYQHSHIYAIHVEAFKSVNLQKQNIRQSKDMASQGGYPSYQQFKGPWMFLSTLQVSFCYVE